MFFSERIKSIKPGYRVLEVGPGASPHARADVILEKRYTTVEEHVAQSGHAIPSIEPSKMVWYDGDTFPFRNHEFDYVICSHVLEHVDNVEKFLSEIQRVGKSGYLEFPTIYYDYIFNIPEHLNVLYYNKSTICWAKKMKSFRRHLNFYKAHFMYHYLKIMET